MTQTSLATGSPLAAPVDLLAWATTRASLRSDIGQLPRRLRRVLRESLDRAEFQPTNGSTFQLQTHGSVAPRVILLVGVDAALAPLTWHRLADATVTAARDLKARRVAIAFGGDLANPGTVGATTEGIALSAYVFDRFKSKPKAHDRPTRIELLVPRSSAPLRRALTQGQQWAAATCYARDLILTPSCEVTPRYLAAEAKQIAQRHRLRVRVRNQRALARLGMGALLGVAQGSVQPPRLIELVYRPRQRPRKRVAIVGKGITFDSGGLSLKHADSMQGQKRDMAGGAVVLGVMQALGALAPPVEVRGYVAAAENMPDGRAMKPGDVVRAHNGKTIEVLNTDAEGRLVLADALSYAAEAKPDVMIDLATLTAAVGTALGRRYAGVMGTDAALVQALIAAGQRAGENLWELPLVEEYRSDLDSRVADLKNTGEGHAGTIIGGLFLREFVGEVPWAHIDFSSTVVTEKRFPGHPPGATGFGVRTLLQYITSL